MRTTFTSTFVLLNFLFVRPALSQVNGVIFPDSSPRANTYGEGAIAVPNSEKAPFLGTPTSGVSHKIEGALYYGAVSGKQKFELEYEILGEVQKSELKSDLTGNSLNGLFFVPLPTSIKSGVLIKGNSQKFRYESQSFGESFGENAASTINISGMMQVNKTTFAITVMRNTESIDGSTDSSNEEYSWLSKDSGSGFYYAAALGLRQELTPSISLAATYAPKASKSYCHAFSIVDEIKLFSV